MSNNKQSSVDWLIEQLKEYDFSPRENTYLIEIPSWIFTEKIDKAKTMHKEEIEIAFAKSYLIGVEGVSYDDVNKASAKYYNETFGKDEA